MHSFSASRAPLMKNLLGNKNFKKGRNLLPFQKFVVTLPRFFGTICIN